MCLLTRGLLCILYFCKIKGNQGSSGSFSVSLKRLRTWEKKCLWWWFCGSGEGPKDWGQEFLLRSWTDLRVFGKATSSFSHICKLYRGISTYYARSRVHAKASLDRGLWIGIFVLHNFRGLSPNKLQLIAHKRVQGSLIDCTCPLPALWSNHICLVYVSPLSLHESVKQTKEREVMEEKKQSHVSTKCFPKTQNKQLEKTGNNIAFNL